VEIGRRSASSAAGRRATLAGFGTTGLTAVGFAAPGVAGPGFVAVDGLAAVPAAGFAAGFPAGFPAAGRTDAGRVPSRAVTLATGTTGTVAGGRVPWAPARRGRRR
jgi:hypothetical protein